MLAFYSHGARRVNLLRVDQTNSKQLFWKRKIRVFLHRVSQLRVRSLRVCWTYFLKWAPGILSQIWLKGSDEQDEKWKIVKTEFLLKSVSLVMRNWWSIYHNAGYFVTSLYCTLDTLYCLILSDVHVKQNNNKIGSVAPPWRAAPATGLTWMNKLNMNVCHTETVKVYCSTKIKKPFWIWKTRKFFWFSLYMGKTGNISVQLCLKWSNTTCCLNIEYKYK